MGGKNSKNKKNDGTLTPEALSTPGSRDVLGLQSPKAHRKSYPDNGTWPRGAAPEPPLSIVILGSENNGKSTFWKSTLSQFGKPLLLWMQKEVKPSVTKNVIACLRALCQLSKDQGSKDEKYAVQSDEARNALNEVLEIKEDEEKLSETFVNNAKILWKDSGIKACYANRNAPGFPLEGADNAEYLMRHLDRISKDDYEPTEEDAIRSYTRTRGTGEHVNHIECKVDRHYLLVYDTDGQVQNRSNWQQVHSFEGVSAIVFVVSLTNFDQVLVENGETNAFDDSLDYFESICALEDFKDTPIVLLLNKNDRLKEKLSSGVANFSSLVTDSVDENNSMTEDQIINIYKQKFEERYLKHRHHKGDDEKKADVDRGDHDFLVTKAVTAINSESVRDVVTNIVRTLYAHHANVPKDYYHKRHSTNALTRIFSNRDLAHSD